MGRPRSRSARHDLHLKKRRRKTVKQERLIARGSIIKNCGGISLLPKITKRSRVFRVPRPHCSDLQFLHRSLRLGIAACFQRQKSPRAAACLFA